MPSVVVWSLTCFRDSQKSLEDAAMVQFAHGWGHRARGTGHISCTPLSHFLVPPTPESSMHWWGLCLLNYHVNRVWGPSCFACHPLFVSFPDIFWALPSFTFILASFLFGSDVWRNSFPNEHAQGSRVFTSTCRGRQPVPGAGFWGKGHN